MQVVINICSAIGILITILCSYKFVTLVLGLLHKKKFKPTNNKHTYGICIAARNEEIVIQNLLESIANQDYPQDKLRIFVVADNCTDSTAQKVKEFAENHKNMNFSIYEHNDPNERTKGYALRYMFKQIEKEFTIEGYDGYIIFDADNVLHPDFVTRMNEAFDSGEKIITSFRNSKNFNSNWISFSYAAHWARTCLIENRGKYYLNMSCRIQGAGFLIANEIVKNGWNWTTLSEDRHLCTESVIAGYHIAYCDNAQFYDEQPETLKMALRQRLRWARGLWLSTIRNCPKLLKNAAKLDENAPNSFDCFWLNFPGAIESACRSILTYSMQFGLAIAAGNAGGGLLAILIAFLTGQLTWWIEKMFEASVAVIWYKKRIGKMPFFKTVFHILMFPFFDVIGKLTSYVAPFTKVDWKPIPHNTVMDIDELNKKDT